MSSQNVVKILDDQTFSLEWLKNDVIILNKVLNNFMCQKGDILRTK